MAGLTKNSPIPTAVTVHQASKVLEVAFADGAAFRIPFKRDVGVVGLEQVGNYAVQPEFSDGHNTGLFTWDYLYFLGSQQKQLWEQYEGRLQAAGVVRDAAMVGKNASACGSHSH
jgi:DUF971 family protein